ncbi:MipA/OmpV family protein [Thalassomonas viridans]|uniref:MipA/OmpV family protein n=1 Tax=Thalassomonas viridans TaxID=137584 RepID=A0AAE9Z1G1_9GAMM|nr:MipA/OmpV family protein [Thalassomonas viridans]WDE04885.1 MipA/OmpV family protein [Thalassomonas viridans]
MKFLALSITGFTVLSYAAAAEVLPEKLDVTANHSLLSIQKSIDSASSTPKKVPVSLPEKYLDTGVFTPDSGEKRLTFRDNLTDSWSWNPNSIDFRPEAMSAAMTSNANFLEKQVLKSNRQQPLPQLNVSYQGERLSVKSGFLTEPLEHNQGNKFFLQGSYSIWSFNRFDISVTAKIETLDKDIIQSYYPVENNHIKINELSTNKTLGLIGTFALGSRWKMIGAITTTTIGSEITSPLIENNTFNMALIGTTYSF